MGLTAATRCSSLAICTPAGSVTLRLPASSTPHLSNPPPVQAQRDTARGARSAEPPEQADRPTDHHPVRTRMRLKKLSANRRHKAGEDEASGADSEPQNWVSPSKPARGADFSGGNASGASSPTDPSSAQAAAALQQQPQVEPHSAELFGRGVAVIQTMDNGADKSGDWRDAVDRAVREAVHAKIVEALRRRKPNAPTKVLDRLPGLAYRMEEALFKMAVSRAEYSDVATLGQRIARIQENNAKRLLAQQQQQAAGGSQQNAVAPQGTVQMPKPLPEEQARVVFQHLQTWRQKLVTMYGVAPWEILPNQTLAKVALYMPSTEQELVVCGVHDEQVARFGSSLIQELQLLRGLSPAPTNPTTRQTRSASKGRKSEAIKRGSADAMAGGSNKRRKNGTAASAAVLAPAAPSPNLNGTSMMSPSQLMFRSQGGLPDSLPTLLPSATAGVSATSMSSSSTPVRLSPAPVMQQPPFFARVQPQQQESPSPTQENHMHLLVQGAGQLSKQQDVKSLEVYEQEVQSLRWMLHQSQLEKSQLESEVQRLRAQLQRGSK